MKAEDETSLIYYIKTYYVTMLYNNIILLYTI